MVQNVVTNAPIGCDEIGGGRALLRCRGARSLSPGVTISDSGAASSSVYRAFLHPRLGGGTVDIGIGV